MPSPYTSIQSGLFNGDIWGQSGAWPNKTGDVINIGTTAGQAHIVTYNISNPFVDIEGLSRAAACVVTHVGHGLLAGDYISFRGITQDPTLPKQWVALNGMHYSITVIDVDSYSIPVDTSAFTNAYAPATDPGKLRKQFPLAR